MPARMILGRDAELHHFSAVLSKVNDSTDEPNLNLTDM